MALGYRLSPEAQADIIEIRDYYLETVDVRVARYVLAEIRRAFRLLVRFPQIGHSREDLTDETVKFWAVSAFFIVYDPAAKPIGIARVLHASRDIGLLLYRAKPFGSREV